MGCGPPVIAGVGDLRRVLLGLWRQDFGPSVFFSPLAQRGGRRAGRWRGAGGSAKLAFGLIPEFLVASGGMPGLFRQLIGEFGNGAGRGGGSGVHDDSIVFTGPFRDNSTVTLRFSNTHFHGCP